MNEAERLELLRQVAECAPWQWGLHASDVEDYGHLAAFLYLMGQDTEDAPAIIRMLDEMEKRGWMPDIVAGYVRLGPGAPIGYICTCYKSEQHSFIEAEGDTRAQAVAKAFVQVMSTEVLSSIACEPDTATNREAKGKDIPLKRQPKRVVKIEGEG